MLKIASMVGAPDLGIPTLAPYSDNLEVAFQKLAALGYDGIELMTKQPSRLDGSQIRRLLAENGLEISGLCSGHIFGEDQLGLLRPDLTINREAVARLKEFVDFTADSFGPGKCINIGRSRGIGDPTRMEQTLALAAEVFTELAEYAAPRGVNFVLEPVRRQELNFIHSTRDGLEMARRVNRPNFGLNLDTFHMHIEDDDMFASFSEAAPFIWHIHFSDSDRRYPGTGAIDYGRVVQALNAIGYTGFVSMENQVWPDADTVARESIRHIRQFN